LPQSLAGAGIKGNQETADVVVFAEDELVIHEHRELPARIRLGTGRGMLPKLLAVEIVA